MILKLCKKCLQTKEINLFEKSPVCKGGYSHRCLDCKKIAATAYDNSPEAKQKKQERHKKYYPSKYQATAKYNGNWEYYFKTNLTRKDRSALSVEFLTSLLEKQEGVCAISGVTLTCIVAPGAGPNNTNASIDRIIPGSDGGLYEPTNVRLVCGIVNKMRGTMSDEELKYWCSQIIENKKLSEKTQGELLSHT
jgi:hypothetical protein